MTGDRTTGDHAFSATTRANSTGSVLAIRGDLDAATTPEVLERIKGLTLGSGQLLVVDVAGMSFCDSSGISALIAAHNVTEAASAGIALVAVPAQLTRILDLVGLADFFPIFPSAEHAIAAHT